MSQRLFWFNVFESLALVFFIFIIFKGLIQKQSFKSTILLIFVAYFYVFFVKITMYVWYVLSNIESFKIALYPHVSAWWRHTSSVITLFKKIIIIYEYTNVLKFFNIIFRNKTCKMYSVPYLKFGKSNIQEWLITKQLLLAVIRHITN